MLHEPSCSPCGVWDTDRIDVSDDERFKLLCRESTPPPLGARTPPTPGRSDGHIAYPCAVPPVNLLALFEDQAASDVDDGAPQGVHPRHPLQLWALDTSCPHLAAAAADALQGLPERDRARVLKYRNVKDRHHSLVSVLMQRSLIQRTFQVTEEEYSILRTAENKPYLCLGPRDGEKGTWNYNVSHQGDFVCILSHPRLLVGVDIVEVKLRATWRAGVPAYIDLFKGNQFSAAEVQRMLQQSDPLTHFFINWSMKEAFIKAIGTGLYYELETIEFVIVYDSPRTGGEVRGTAQVWLNKVLQPKWSFAFCSLNETHIVSVATGPVDDAADSFVHAIGARGVPDPPHLCTAPTDAAYDLLSTLEFVNVVQLLP